MIHSKSYLKFKRYKAHFFILNFIIIHMKQTELYFYSELPSNFLEDTLILFVLHLDEPIFKVSTVPNISDKLPSIIKKREFKGEFDEMDYYYHPDLSVDKYIFIGLGKPAEITLERIRRAIANALKMAKKVKARNIAIDLSLVLDLDPKECTKSKGNSEIVIKKSLIEATVHGILLSIYSFDQFKTEEKETKSEKKDLNTINLYGIPKEYDQYFVAAKNIAKYVNMVRDWGNLPANIGTPEYFAEESEKLAKQFKNKVYIEVYDKKHIEKMGWNTFLSVTKGSEIPNEPKLVILKNFEKEPIQGKKTIALVGKGITFDTGGYSIKESDGLFEMKTDMLGAATAISTFFAATELNLELNLISITPFTPNLINGRASLPGDIVKSLAGLTVEILNTDAEGRLILADALTYADTFKPDYIIDLATLTGSSIVALGNYAAALFCKNEDMKEKLMKAAEMTHERLWPLPLFEEFVEDLKSDIADIKNIVAREGGASYGAAFLSKFTKTEKWAHIDIAPVGAIYANKHHAWGYHPSGCTGFGVRLLIAFLESLQ